MTQGGKKNCPCGTPGFWNKNWFNQVIQVPGLVGDTCLLLKDKLSTSQKESCTRIQARAFDNITNRTGANLLDIASIGISLGLLKEDADLLEDALTKFYNGVFINPVTAGDGIQSDGSFMQHDGLLYSGNYGKDYINELVSVFVETQGTALVPSADVQNAFKTLLSGSEWMIIADAKLNKLLWQYSVIGRMVSFKYSDKQASGGVAIDFNKVEKTSQGWDTEESFDAITDRLNAPHVDDANQGDLVGTRYFYNADYMVHRAPNYITTLKMYSSRTINSECLNAQNPFGFHLSDGAIFNYLSGDEYLDAFGTWNWELVPGITVDIGGTPLTCPTVKKKGVKPFVGGVADYNTGIAVMEYENPTNHNLKFQKTAFFFPSAYAVQIGPIESKNSTAQLVTVLDQRKRNGDIYVAGKLRNTNTTYATVASNSIWHDSIGYYFPTSEILYVDSKPRNADWSAFGISEGTDEQQLWTSYIKHSTKSTTGLLTQYVVQPNIQQSDFQNNVSGGTIPISLAFHASEPQVNAAYSAIDKAMGIAFWTAGTYETPWNSISVTTDSPCVIMLTQTADNVYHLVTSDPSQSLTVIKLAVRFGTVKKTLTVDLPTGSDSGKKVGKTITLTA
ncbi:galactose mutarotase-like domain-containing protein [Mucor mucedo]|uniref:galactose mutarotase-like domain-containing protein n=1 Tax=Mucor mucedo TaxID=29922 RepID=UPI002220433A|nr:galactose mutarotase-like domain-containing protein [Mucor mucedo]KAI7894163.1 galactose mutarotase-like domain-containing protein [Mucor mucedo]